MPLVNYASICFEDPMNLTPFRAECRAVDRVFGMRHDAHMMVICAVPTENSDWILNGNEKEFRCLLENSL